VALEAIDPALHRVALFVVGLVELRRPTPREPGFLRLRTWSAFSGIVHRMPRWRRWARFTRDPHALSARTLCGRVRGRPRARRGTRMASRIGCNCGLSCRWPAVTISDYGFCPYSTVKCSFVVSPPRERPRPWSSGSVSTPPGGSFRSAPFYGPRQHAGGPARSWSPR
jgi:hypothetical protein